MTVPDPQAVAAVAEAIWQNNVTTIAKRFDMPATSVSFHGLEDVVQARYFAIAKVAIRAHLDFIHRMSASG